MLYLKPEQIEFSPTLRPDDYFNNDLFESIKEIGLINPPSVKLNPKTQKYRVIEGNCRVRCLIKLDQLIPCKLLKGYFK